MGDHSAFDLKPRRPIRQQYVTNQVLKTKKKKKKKKKKKLVEFIEVLMSDRRFQYQSVNRYGLIEKVGGVETITRIWATAPRSWSEFDGAERGDLPLSQVRLLSPVEPSKVVCIGRNYREHAKELNHPIPTEPLFFLQALIFRLMITIG